MIQVAERFRNDGTIKAHLTGLPAGASCQIIPYLPGHQRLYVYVTCNGPVAGRRYNGPCEYEAAVERAIKWAQRKLREAR